MTPTATALTSEAPNTQTIHLADQVGPDVSGRTRGEAIRLSVEPGATEVIFDCTGVESMSPSFADEVFGKLAEQPQRPAIRVVNAAPDILSLIRFSVQERTSA
jgi:hypothetical protein